MRIRKLAKELGTDDVSVLHLLGRLGHGRYTDPEQQLPAAVEAQVRRHARDLPKLGANTLPAPRPAPAIPTIPAEDLDEAMFARAMASVQPLGAQAKPAKPAPPKAAAAPRPAPKTGVPAAPIAGSGPAAKAGVPAAPAAGSGPATAAAGVKPGPTPRGAVPAGPVTVKASAPKPAPPPAAAPVVVPAAPAAAVPAAPAAAVPAAPAAGKAAPVAVKAVPGARAAAPVPPTPVRVPPKGAPMRAPPLELQLAEERQRAEGLATALAEAEARATAAEARVAELSAAASAAEARVAASATRAAELELEQARLERALAAAKEPPEPATLRACFERRGLLGDDEIAAALRALLDAHRVGELARLALAQPDQLDELLWERVLLLTEDEAPPAGVVAVRVPAERSEGRQASVNRAAMSRFSTACLVRNLKRVVIVGGSPAYHRMLREGLDPRLDVRLIPGNRRGRVPQVPGADLVILWASTILDHSVSAQFPEGVVIPHRGIARMLGAATEWIESRAD